MPRHGIEPTLADSGTTLLEPDDTGRLLVAGREKTDGAGFTGDSTVDLVRGAAAVPLFGSRNATLVSVIYAQLMPQFEQHSSVLERASAGTLAVLFTVLAVERLRKPHDKAPVCASTCG